MPRSLMDFREERYLTIAEFADLLGITPRTLYRIVQGQVKPRMKTMRHIAGKLAVDPSEIAEFARKSSNPQKSVGG